MPDAVNKYYTPVKARWDLLTPAQRYKLLGVFAVVLVAIALTAFFAFRTPWETIVRREGSEVIRPMAIALGNAGIPYRTRDYGSSIQVDRRHVDEALGIIQMQGAVPNQEHFTWETALDTGLGTTDDERRRRDILGMEGQIERQLIMANGVLLADVSLAIPTTRPFERNPVLPSAAVILTIGEDFSPQQGRNMALTVARNVSRLTIENVIIVDQFMRSVWNGETENDGIANQTNQERTQHINHVTTSLHRLFSPLFEQVTVVFNPRFDDRLLSEEVRNMYRIPEGMEDGGIVTQDTGQRAEMEGGMGGIEPGLANNMAAFPNYVAPGGGIMSAAQREWATNFAIDNIRTITQYGAGWVVPEQSTGSVSLIRDRHLDQADWIAEDPENRNADAWRRFKNENAAPVLMNGVFEDFYEFHELIATAMGIPSANVSLVIHERIIPVDTEIRVWDIPTILMVLVLLLLLAMLLYGLLRRQKAADEEEESLEPQLAVEDLLVSTQLEEAKEEEAAQLEEIDYFKENELKKHIEKFVNEKPEAVASLLRNWINVEEW
ncbi:MAG: hypothetical protein FWB80_02150 [Defluviitaleaceae bacterium]|nr:hypothetical protein [Defluviitaleaceae bacterium]